MRTSTPSFILLFAILFLGHAVAAHELPPVAPHGFDRAITQLDVSSYQLKLEPGESVSFAADEIKKITIDEASIVSAERTDEDRIVLTGGDTGKAVVRLMWSNKDVEMDHNAKHGIGMFITTIIVNVGE